MESKKMVSAIEARFPEIRIKKYERITTGWENLVLEINGQYIFRFPRNSRGWLRQKREIVFVRWLGPKLGTPILNYEFFWSGSKSHQQKLAGYRKIPGVLLDEKNFQDEWTDELGDDFGRFLTQLHNIRIPHEISKIVPTYDLKTWINGWPRFYQAARRYVYPLLDGNMRRRAEEFWEAYVDHFSGVRFKPTLIHSDLGYGNIIVDASAGRLAGVIDWEDRQVGDPALDFVGLFIVSEGLGERALARYKLGHSGFRKRIGFYSTSSAFGEAAIGVQRQEKQYINSGLEHIRERLGART